MEVPILRYFSMRRLQIGCKISFPTHNKNNYKMYIVNAADFLCGIFYSLYSMFFNSSSLLGSE